MQTQHRKLTFKDKVQAFLDHLEIARLEIGVLRTRIECVQRNVDDFCARVSKVVRPCYDRKPLDEITVQDKMKIIAEPDLVRNVDGFLFYVVELVERRLFTANTAFGLTFTFIATHYQYAFEEPNCYTFSWKIMFRDIREPFTYPTIESTLREIEMKRRLYKRKQDARDLHSHR